MRKIVRVVVGTLGFLLLAELGLRLFGPGFDPVAGLYPERSVGGYTHLRADLDVWHAASRLRTDDHGHRAAFAPRRGDEEDFHVLVWGSEFSCALGVDDDEHFAARLQEHLRETLGVGDARVSVWAAHGDVRARLLALPELCEELRPDCVLVQVAERDCDIDGDASAPRAPFVDTDLFCVRGEVHGTWTEFDPTPSRLVDLVRHWFVRRDREAVQDSVAALIERDGLCPRASENAKRRFLDFQRRQPGGGRTPSERPVLSAQLRLRYDSFLAATLDEVHELFLQTFEELQRQGVQVLMMEVGPDEPMEAIREAARTLNVPQVDGPPDFLDPRLIIGSGHPAAIVHEYWGRSLAAAMYENGALRAAGLPAELPAVLDQAARDIESFHARSEGHELEVFRVAHDSILRELVYDGSPLLWVFGGVEGGGALRSPLRLALQLAGASDPIRLEIDVPDAAALAGQEASVWLGEESSVATWREIGGDGHRLVALFDPPANAHSTEAVGLEFRLPGVAAAGGRLRRVTVVQEAED